MNILVTGGAGFIGSHTVREILQSGNQPVIFDNLSTGHAESVSENVPFVVGNLHNRELLASVFRLYSIDAVIHLAAYSLVGESSRNPSAYYYNNLIGTINLLDTMHLCGVERIAFSSTAAVYGEPSRLPIREDAPLLPTSVYGRAALMIENIVKDFGNVYQFSYVALRCFNAAGASLDAKIGEAHNPETHLIPLVMQAAAGQKTALDIFGTDYPTPDGTCIRDYVHVSDVAYAHVLAMEHLKAGGESRVYNLGSERGYSVRDVVLKARQTLGIPISVRELSRRRGDPAFLVASCKRIQEDLGWKAKNSSLDSIIKSAWTWQKSHPRGFLDSRSICSVE